MIKQLLQCCYTNVTETVGTHIASGWKSVAVSDQLSHEARTCCEQIQGRSSAINGAMLDENDHILNLLEIEGDGSYLYMIRTQYGIQDRGGRRNMFSHGFILPFIEEKTTRDPNTFLTIANENFQVSQEAAEASYEEVLRLPAFTLASAMERCGLTAELYEKLADCIYAQTLPSLNQGKVHNHVPLYVQYDGTEEHLRALLYCIYSVLPFAARKMLTVASCFTDNLTNKDIIFSIHARSKPRYVEPTTGENNILTGRNTYRIGYLGYPRYVAVHCTRQDPQLFFEEMERRAVSLGDVTASNENTLQIAFRMMTEEKGVQLDEITLERYLSDAVSANSSGSQVMNHYIADLVNRVTTQKMTLTEDMLDSLDQWVEREQSKELNDALERYRYYLFSQLSTQNAALELEKLPRIMFDHFRKKLEKDSYGLEVLNQYFVNRLSGEQSWGSLKSLLIEASFMPQKDTVEEAVQSSAISLYESYVQEGLTQGQMDKVSVAYEEYTQLMNGILPVMDQQNCANAAKEIFWEQFSLLSTSPDNVEDYRKLRLEGNQKCRLALLYCNLYTDYQDNSRIFFAEAVRFLTAAEKEIEDTKESIDSLVSAVSAEAMSRYTGINKNYWIWCSLFLAAKSQEVLETLEDVFDLTEAHRFEEALNRMEKIRSILRKKDSIKLVRLLVDECGHADTEANPLPLDLWLRLGGYLYENAFRLFDNIQPYIVDENPAIVVEQSKYLRIATYKTWAEEYVKSKGECRQVVKRWLSEYKQQIKKNSSFGGVGFGFLSNREARMGDVEPENPPAKHSEEVSQKETFGVPAGFKDQQASTNNRDTKDEADKWPKTTPREKKRSEQESHQAKSRQDKSRVGFLGGLFGRRK